MSAGERSALVLTISDGVARGTRFDESGEGLARRLAELGFAVERAACADEPSDIGGAVTAGAVKHQFVITTGGTGLGPRDRTPQTLDALLDYQLPGFGEQMRAHGRRATPFADLSRSLAGVIDQTLVVAVPGSPRAALESLAALEPILDHALETLGGRTAHAGTEEQRSGR
ncbi:MAG TPA: MogA/MoaB family molybdenum cofactor biosynthesis protein [Candidatus Limnocylindria bacterium]|jgi:molybdenum cofactor synthesis domain-containing protein|nr:MogA/MoaB family molybdenum cofactor biosynthesis protein [Candidatus Limnocylindria bacterium]